MKYSIVAFVLASMISCAYARDESYVPDGFIGQSARLLRNNIAIVTVEVSKWGGPEKPIEVKVIEVLHGPKALLSVTTIYDDAFDPVFHERFKTGTKWILRITPQGETGSGKWTVSYYETSHLEVKDDDAIGSILKHREREIMKYTALKKLLSEKLTEK